MNSTIFYTFCYKAQLSFKFLKFLSKSQATFILFFNTSGKPECKYRAWWPGSLRLIGGLLSNSTAPSSPRLSFRGLSRGFSPSREKSTAAKTLWPEFGLRTRRWSTLHHVSCCRTTSFNWFTWISFKSHDRSITYETFVRFFVYNLCKYPEKVHSFTPFF